MVLHPPSIQSRRRTGRRYAGAGVGGAGADRRLELVLEIRRRPGADGHRRLAGARGTGGPHLRLRQAEPRRLSVPHRGRLRSRLGRLPQRSRAAGGQARPHSGGGAGLRPDAADRRIHRPAHGRRSGTTAQVHRQLEARPVQPARHAARARARIAGVRSARRRPLGRRDPAKPSARPAHRAAWPPGGRLGHRQSGDRGGGAGDASRRARSASGGGAAGRCRSAGDAARL